MGVVQGEPIISPDYSLADVCDSFSVRLPDGTLLCVEYNPYDDKLHNLYVLDSDGAGIINRIG